MLGKEILGYHVDEKIGSGGFGTVYKVSKTNVTGTYVRALKHIEVPTKRQYVNILNSMGGDSTKADDYFANILKNIVGEIKILSALSESGNQNIVRYYENDVIETHSPKKYDIYILMEYLTPFPEYLDNTSLTVKDVIKLGKDILNALIACHGRNIIHRDIKDDNIFVAPDGTYKIGDFGVSKALKDQSRAASIKGTPNFIAPEVYLGKENYDHTVDLYSLGIVLYRLLNNSRNPFLPEFPNAYTSEDEDIAFEARMAGKIPELPNMAKNELGEAILKAIKPRNERYNTAKEFLDALEKAEKALSPVYLSQAIGIFNASHPNEETVAFSNLDADVTIAASMFSGQAEEQKSNDSDLFKTVGLFSDGKDNDHDKTVALNDLPDESKQEVENEVPCTELEFNKENDKKLRRTVPIIIIVAVIFLTIVALGLSFFLKNNGDSYIGYESDTDGYDKGVSDKMNDLLTPVDDLTMEQIEDVVYVLYPTKIRASTKLSAEILIQVPFGTILTRSEKNNKWSKVTYKNDGAFITGYVINDVITTNAKSINFIEQKKYDETAFITKIKHTLNGNAVLRKYPLAEGYPNTFKVLDCDEFNASSIVAKLPAGTNNITVVSVSEDGVWAYVKGKGNQYNGGTLLSEYAEVEGYTLYSNLEIHTHSYKEGYCTICGLYREGNKVTFGSYPQTEVTESALKSTLNAKAGTLPTSNNSYKWISYGYYDNGELSNFMWYIDVIQDGLKYRGVYFTSYRHICTTKSLQVDDSYQDNNGYYTNTIYWFKYEPISWTILSENTTNGTALILCDMIIDSQEYYITDSGTRTIDGKTVYPNNYAHSTIRKWLNETFYNTAFSELQKQVIITTDVDNGVTSTGYDSNLYACENTNDKVFLLSRQDITDTLYGFEKSTSIIDIMRQKKTTDYAQSQGCYTNNGEYAGNGWWMLRSPNNNESVYSYVVDKTGQAYLINYVNYVNQGVVPALQIDLSGKNEDSIYTREGDKITFGSYPQTEVTESTLKATLNAKAGTLPTSDNSQAWTSYEYYMEGEVSDFMWYIDVEEGGEKYRGVYFMSYRPWYTTAYFSPSNTHQDNNGYINGIVYWFRYEPISWTILGDVANGTALILCDMIIDSQEYYTSTISRMVDGKTVYANNYECSTIRKWLNEIFYNTAFNEFQKQIILTTVVDNGAITTSSSTNQYACKNTKDKIFLLSYQDVINDDYRFASNYSTYDVVRQKKTTDYAQAQGTYTYNGGSYAGNGWWWLRSPCDDGDSDNA